MPPTILSTLFMDLYLLLLVGGAIWQIGRGAWRVALGLQRVALWIGERWPRRPVRPAEFSPAELGAARNELERGRTPAALPPPASGA